MKSVVPLDYGTYEFVDGDAPSQPTAQLDTAEREQLEAVVAEMRDRVEDNVRFQLTQRGLDEGPAEADDASLVEAHLADLFDYFCWRLKGSDHYSSTGILLLTYYFEREGGDLLDDHGHPYDTPTADERLLASLATTTTRRWPRR